MNKVVIVASMFNKEITDKLLAGAYLAWEQNSSQKDAPEVFWVPGAIEIPLMAQKLLPACDAVVALGCVIQGETKHFDYVCNMVSNGCLQVSLEYGKPVIFGVLTTCNWSQASERAGGAKGNKGFDAMLSAINMLDTLRSAGDRGD